MSAQFRYSRDAHHRTVFSAAGLTAIVTFLVWLFARLSGADHVVLVTAIAAVCFFTFCSAAMMLRYWRGAVVLAVRPDGLFDARIGRQALSWDNMRRIDLERAENDFRLVVLMWKRDGGTRRVALDLSPLDGDVQEVVAAIAAYQPVRMPDA